MFSNPSSLQTMLSYLSLLSFSLLITLNSLSSPETHRESLLRPQNLSTPAFQPAAQSWPSDFIKKQFEGKEISIGMVNVEDEAEVRKWREIGRTTDVRFDRATAEMVRWEELFPEWIDEEESREVPKCPEIPMPRFEDYGDFDVVVVKSPCGGDRRRGERDVFRLQVNLIAANLAVRSTGRRGKGTPAPPTLVVFVGACEAMIETFRCEDLVQEEGHVRVYRPNIRRLIKKLHLPVGSCQLSIPLINQDEGKSYNFSISNHPKEAYITVLHSSESYVCGAIALAHSLLRTNTTKDLLLLADASITATSRLALTRAGWNIRDIHRIRSPFSKKSSYNEWNYSKLRIWQQTDYDKLVFIDADFVVLDSLDGLFASPQISAAGNDMSRFNSGVMLVEPSECTFKMLMERAQEVEPYNGGDQGLLNEVFTWWHRWPKRANWLKVFERGGNSREVPANTLAVHFLGTKPWMCSRECDCNWEEWSQQIFASDSAHRRWWEVFDAMPEELQRFCGLSERLHLRLRKMTAKATRSRLANGCWDQVKRHRY